MDPKNLSSNWKKLQETLKNKTVSLPKRKASDRVSRDETAVKKRKRHDEKTKPDRPRLTKKKKRMSDGPDTGNGLDFTGKTARRPSMSNTSTTSQNAADKTTKVNEGRSTTTEIGKYIAMDCEMVGVGPNPDHESALARVSIVNFNGEQIYDSFVRPKEMVTDWRTKVSGIAPRHMVEARTLEEVQKDVFDILEGRVLIGHAVSNDLDALLFSHPKRDIRDTSKHPPYRKVAGGGSPRLKILAAEYLGLEIQGGAHSSVEDAKATMLLYRRDKDGFEREHAKKWPVRTVMETKETEEQKKKKKKKKPRKR